MTAPAQTLEERLLEEADKWHPSQKSPVLILREAATEITRLKAALSEARENGWQPIDTAPKDGTRIECLHADAALDVVQWEEYRCCMLGPRAGSFPPGWQNEDRLPVDDPIFWRSLSRMKAGE